MKITNYIKEIYIGVAIIGIVLYGIYLALPSTINELLYNIGVYPCFDGYVLAEDYSCVSDSFYSNGKNLNK